MPSPTETQPAGHNPTATRPPPGLARHIRILGRHAHRNTAGRPRPGDRHPTATRHFRIVRLAARRKQDRPVRTAGRLGQPMLASYAPRPRSAAGRHDHGAARTRHIRPAGGGPNGTHRPTGSGPNGTHRPTGSDRNGTYPPTRGPRRRSGWQPSTTAATYGAPPPNHDPHDRNATGVIRLRQHPYRATGALQWRGKGGPAGCRSRHSAVGRLDRRQPDARRAATDSAAQATFTESRSKRASAPPPRIQLTHSLVKGMSKASGD